MFCHQPPLPCPSIRPDFGEVSLAHPMLVPLPRNGLRTGRVFDTSRFAGAIYA